jgi:hypothetical protein
MGAGKSVMGAWDEGSEVLASANTSAS